MKGEKRFYKPIGEWLIESGKCNRDEYSNGYGMEIEVAPGKEVSYTGGQGKSYISLGDPEDIFRPDVLAIKYEVVAPQYPFIDFHAHCVEVKEKAEKRDLQQVLGKILMVKEGLRRKPYGFNTMSFYIAYPFEMVNAKLLSNCKKEGVGILRLEQVNDTVYVYSMPNCGAKPIPTFAIPHSSMRSPGVFEDTIKGYPHIMKVMPGVVELWEKYYRSR